MEQKNRESERDCKWNFIMRKKNMKILTEKLNRVRKECSFLFRNKNIYKLLFGWWYNI